MLGRKSIAKCWPIGTAVKGSYVLEPYYDGERWQCKWRKLNRVKRPFVGVVVGGKRVALGSREYLGHDEGYIFATCETYFAIRVRESYMGAELLVAPDDLVQADETHKLPLVKPTITRRERKALSQKMSKWPRDERGRWK